MKKIQKKFWEILKKLFPEKRKEILMFIIALPILWLLSSWSNSSQEIKTLTRSSFQESQKKVILEYEYKGKHEFSDTMLINPGKVKDSSEVIRKKLESSAEIFRQKLLDADLFEQINNAWILPNKFQEAKVSYQFQPENLLSKEGDWNYFEVFEDKPKQEIVVQANFEYEEQVVSISQKLTIGANNFSQDYIQKLLQKKLARQIDVLREGNDPEMELPSTLEGGAVRWKKFNGNAKPLEMLGTLIFIIAVLSFISREAAKEKERKRRQNYLRDFTQMIHHLVLLMKCGKNPYTAIVETCQNSTGFSKDFQEAKEDCYQKIYHQEDMAVSVGSFYKKCPLPEIKRFEQLFSRAYERGDEWSVNYLEEFRDELFAKRLRQANEHMQKATSRLVFPMALFLIIIVILTIVPAFNQNV